MPCGNNKILPRLQKLPKTKKSALTPILFGTVVLKVLQNLGIRQTHATRPEIRQSPPILSFYVLLIIWLDNLRRSFRFQANVQMSTVYF
jgi:hypothetical protein